VGRLSIVHLGKECGLSIRPVNWGSAEDPHMRIGWTFRGVKS